MQISYETFELKCRCLRIEDAEAHYGRNYAGTIISLLAEAEAFDRVSDWREFIGDEWMVEGTKGFAVDIGTRYRASFVSVDRHHRENDDGQVDWSSVEYIKLLKILERQ